MIKIIAGLQTSVDCFIEGPNGELDWAMAEDEETWNDMNEMLNSVDTLILGRRMYPQYEQYWISLLANPSSGTEKMRVLDVLGELLQGRKKTMGL